MANDVPKRWRTGIAAAVVVSSVAMVSFASVPPAASVPSPEQELLAKVEASPLVRWMTAPARNGLAAISGVRSSSDAPLRSTSTGIGGQAISSIAPNVRVNDPAGDGIGDPNMTTQSETSVAASGKQVVVAYNDDGHSPLFLEPTVDLAGYSWSSDGGKTFTDSRMPNKLPGNNVGDPSVAVDRSGHFYYGNLDLDLSTPLLGVVVGRSDDGGRTFHKPTIVSRHTGFTSTATSDSFVTADKPWITVGRSATDPSRDVIYATWTEDYFFDTPRTFGQGTRIMLASSSDHGVTWNRPRVVADDPITNQDERNDTYHFVSGSNVAVDRTGHVYVTWERFVDDGTFTYPTRQEWTARSPDGGLRFRRRTEIATPSPVGTISAPLSCTNTLQFGPGRYVRVQEFPMIAIGPSGAVFVTYNSGDGPGGSSIRVARSDDGGQSWFTKTVRSHATAFMPAIAANAHGVDIVYYEQTTNRTMKVAIATSSDGLDYSNHNLSSVTFSMPVTLPPFDPSTAPCYMGDYVGATRQRGAAYTAWGDNRDAVTNQFWPNGRPDPDVYFAKVT
jgi:hypothetical protein